MYLSSGIGKSLWLQDSASELDDEDLATTAPDNSTGSGSESEWAKEAALDALRRNRASFQQHHRPKSIHPPSHIVTVGNLPEACTERMLLEELQDGGFVKQRDFGFIDMPMHASSPRYCAINFFGATSMRAFVAAFDGRKLRHFNEVLTVTAAQQTVAQAKGPQYPLCPTVPSDSVTNCAQCSRHVAEASNFCMHCGGSLRKPSWMTTDVAESRGGAPELTGASPQKCTASWPPLLKLMEALAEGANPGLPTYESWVPRQKQALDTAPRPR